MLLRAHDSVGRLFDGIHFWAPAEARTTEVDFLLTRGKEIIAIEVKATDRLHEGHFRGLRAIAELQGLKLRVLVYTGSRIQNSVDGIVVWPVEILARKLLRGEL